MWGHLASLDAPPLAFPLQAVSLLHQGRSQAQGWAPSSAGGGLQAVLRMRQVSGLPAPPAAEAGSPTAAQRLSCRQPLLEPTPHGAELPLHPEQGQTTLLQLHLHSKNVRVLQNARGCRKHATTACHSTAEGTLCKAAPAYAWLPQPLGIPEAGKNNLKAATEDKHRGKTGPCSTELLQLWKH